MENVTPELKQFAAAMAAHGIRVDETGEFDALSVGDFEEGFLLVHDVTVDGNLFIMLDSSSNATIARVYGLENVVALTRGFFLS